MDIIKSVVIFGILQIFFVRAQDFQPNIWSADLGGGKMDNVAGVTFFHSNTPSDSSSGLSVWDIGTQKQDNGQENVFSLFTDLSNDRSDPATTTNTVSSNVINSRSLFGSEDNSNIPVVSMKSLDKKPSLLSTSLFNFSVGSGNSSESAQLNYTNSVFDLNQFGIKDEEVAIDNSTNLNQTGNSKDVIAYDELGNGALFSDIPPQKIDGFQTKDTNQKDGQSQVGPSIRVISGFKDHANTPVLMSRGKFIDFTKLNNSNSGNSGTNETQMDWNEPKIDNKDKPGLRGGIALPGIRGGIAFPTEGMSAAIPTAPGKLSPIAVKPFKAFVTDPQTTTLSPVNPGLSPTTTVNTSINNTATKDDNATQLQNDMNHIDTFHVVDTDSSNANSSFSNLPVNSDINLVDQSMSGNINIGGPLVHNHLTAEDITNDLFNNRVTGPVPDGIPAGEKLKIDHLYPIITRQNISSVDGIASTTTSSETSSDVKDEPNNNATVGNNAVDKTSNPQGPVTGPSNNPGLPTVNSGINDQAMPVDNLDRGTVNGNQNFQNRVPSALNNGVNVNNMQTGTMNPGSQFNTFNGANGQLVTNNNGQFIQGNLVQGQGQNWQGQQTNPVLQNQFLDGSFVRGGQQIVNNQFGSSGVPVQQAATNIGNGFPINGFNSGQNRVSNIPNGFILQNGQLIRSGTVSNTGQNVFDTFKSRFNSPFETNPMLGNNMNQLNNNAQVGMEQIPFGQNINNGFRNIPINNINDPTGFQTVNAFSQNVNTDVPNMTGNPFMNNQITLNNFMQMNRQQNQLVADRINRNNFINGNVPPSTNAGNMMMSNTNDILVNPAAIPPGNRVISNQIATSALDSSTGLNSINPSHVQTNAVSNSNNGGINIANTQINGQIASDLNIDAQNTDINRETAQLNNNIRDGMTSSVNQNRISGPAQGNIFDGPGGQIIKSNNQQSNDQTTFVGPNGQIFSNENMRPTNQMIGGGTTSKNQRTESGIQSTNQITDQMDQILNQNINTQQMGGQITNVNPGIQTINTQQMTAPSHLLDNQVNPNLLNMNAQQIPDQNRAPSTNVLNQNMNTQQIQDPNRVLNNQVNPNLPNQNMNTQQIQDQNRVLNNQVNPNLLNRDMNTQQIQDPNRVLDNQVNPNFLNQNMNTQQIQDPNRVLNNQVNPNLLNQNMNTQQIQDPNRVLDNQVNPNFRNQNTNTQQIQDPNRVLNNQVNPNLLNQNMNTPQLIRQNGFQNIPNSQVMNNFGQNTGFRAQNTAQNGFSNTVQTGGFDSRFQNRGLPNIPNVPAGLNQPFVSGPFSNGPPRNFPGQFVNGFPGSFGQFGQFGQPINAGIGR